MNFFSFLSLVAIIVFNGCSSSQFTPVAIEKTVMPVDFLTQVKPILDKRCVVCHSCYNSPCQAKFSSFEGIERGGSKILVYDATRLKAIAPTRLFVDASSTQEWREKGFFSLTKSFRETNSSFDDSLMVHLLYDKQQHPEIIGDYSPEHDDLICPRNQKELKEYLDKKPNHGMPYGLPSLEDNEYKIVTAWVADGAKGPSVAEDKKLKTPSTEAQKQIDKFEAFFNMPDPKHQMTARYLYEHLYLAHLYFPTAKGEYYELIRSTTPAPYPPQIIPTLRPFDDPHEEKFYYRFRKIHATIVHKTHMTLALDERVLQRYKELFIEPKWPEKPHKIGYDTTLSANPFKAFRQIPVASRYQFLLDNSHYIVMTFIRGPVCRGQMALNVIHDHFWVMFKDPAYDFSVMHPEFLDKEADNLALPIADVDESIFRVFSDSYRKRYEAYYWDKVALIKKEFSQGYTYDTIWKGEKKEDAPLLTIYRHYDSASVHKGVLGELPRTMWVIDYAQFERIYYTLVAGYDVYGNVSHQTNIRRYMDFLRIEGELNFLGYMPKSKRLAMLKSWYINDRSVDRLKYAGLDASGEKIVYTTDNPKEEFIETIVNQYINKACNIAFDTINYAMAKQKDLHLPNTYSTLQDYFMAAKAVSVAGSGFISYMSDSGANNIYLRVRLKDGSYLRKSLVINRWHDNVNSLFNEESNLNPKKDTMDILDGSIGSYPNVFVSLDYTELPDFFDLMKNCKGTPKDMQRLKKYFISRSDKDFWKIHDWFLADFYKKDPINAGLYDLNRYARTPWEKVK